MKEYTILPGFTIEQPQHKIYLIQAAFRQQDLRDEEGWRFPTEWEGSLLAEMMLLGVLYQPRFSGSEQERFWFKESNGNLGLVQVTPREGGNGTWRLLYPGSGTTGKIIWVKDI